MNVNCKEYQHQITLLLYEELDEVTGLSRWVVADSPDEKRQPTVQIRDDKHKVLRKYLIPTRAHLMVADGDTVHQGDVLAKIPRELGDSGYQNPLP